MASFLPAPSFIKYVLLRFEFPFIYLKADVILCPHHSCKVATLNANSVLIEWFLWKCFVQGGSMKTHSKGDIFGPIWALICTSGKIQSCRGHPRRKLSESCQYCLSSPLCDTTLCHWQVTSSHSITFHLLCSTEKKSTNPGKVHNLVLFSVIGYTVCTHFKRAS